MKTNKLLFLICLVLVSILFSWGIVLANTQVIKNRTSLSINNSESEEPKNIDTNIKEEEKTVKNINILLIGLDGGGFRSDVIMIMNYEPSTGEIKFLSMPRDTMVKYKGQIGKVNGLYSWGKEELIKNTMEKLTGLKIDYYLTADFTGFRKIIDTLGGVYINVPINMDYEDPEQDLYIHLKKGNQLLNGNKAEQFVRYRKSDTTSGKEIGDLGRMEMQTYLMKELIRQKLDIKYIGKIDDIYTLLKKYVKTNIKTTDINQYLPYVLSISTDKMKSYIVPGEPSLIDNIWYYLVDADKTTQIIDLNFAS